MTFFHVYGRVLALLGPEARLGWLLAGANLALAATQFAEPVLFGRIIDAMVRVQTENRPIAWSDILPLVGAWAAFGIFTVGCGVLVALHADRLAHRRRQVVLTDYFEHVLQLPLSFHGGTHSGRLMKVMLAGTDALWALWLSFFREHFAAFISLLVLLPLSLALNWRLALLLIGLCVVFAALTTLVMRKTQAMQSSVERYYSDLAERTSDALSNVALVQGFARVEAEVAGLRSVVDQLLAAQIPVLSWWAMAAMLTRASTTITMLLIFLVGVMLRVQGLASIGDIVMFISLATLLIARLEQAVSFANRVFMELPRLKEFMDVLDTEPQVRDRLDAVDPGRVRGLVEFSDVSFSYDGRRPAVENLNFTVLPGETVALVGATGAGKSTALALLHRAFDAQSGVIKVDGMDIRALKLAGLRRNIGVVFQETMLFNRSIGENLRIGKPDATIEELREAAIGAQAMEFIERTDDGFEARVGERGRSLSGGERQRLSIARAILKNPPILILDEATSSLDAATETKVQAALDEVMKGRTSFVIAHRLSTVRNATRILVFDKAHIVETGTFDQLLSAGGRFADLAKAQFMTPASAAPPEEQKPAALSLVGEERTT